MSASTIDARHAAQTILIVGAGQAGGRAAEALRARGGRRPHRARGR